MCNNKRCGIMRMFKRVKSRSRNAPKEESELIDFSNWPLILWNVYRLMWI